MRRLILLFVMAFVVAGVLALSATPSQAVHAASGQLTCGNCHTMHSSQGNSQGSSMGTDTGVLKLLRSTSDCSADLCLMCHAENGASGATQFNSGGWQTTPPKVFMTNSAWATDSAFTEIGAGGDFRGVGSYLSTGFTAGSDDTTAGSGPSVGYGHSLCEQNLSPPGGNGGGPGQTTVQIPGYFTCVNCHDPHGTAQTQGGINEYRNLLGDITTQGDGKSWQSDIAVSYVGGVADDASGGSSPTTAANIWPFYSNATDYNGYISDASGEGQMSRFCAQCHGKWHEVLTPDNQSGNDWRRHPVDNALVDASPLSASGKTIVDWAHYNANLFDAKKVPAAQGGGVAYPFADDPLDKEFCISCHFAHGGVYSDALRWEFVTSVGPGTQLVTYLQPMGSYIGCQQCHNRGGIFGT